MHCHIAGEHALTTDCTLIDWVKDLRPTWHKTGHFRDLLHSQSLGLVLKKLNLTQQKQTTQEQNGEKTHRANLQKTYSQLSLTVHTCDWSYHCAKLSYKTQHRKVLMNSPLINQKIINAQMLSITTTTVSRPFFRDHPGEPVPEENFWTLWCKGRLREADTPTIWLGATPSGLTSAHLHHPPIFFTGWMTFLPPNQQRQSTEGNAQMMSTN